MAVLDPELRDEAGINQRCLPRARLRIKENILVSEQKIGQLLPFSLPAKEQRSTSHSSHGRSHVLSTRRREVSVCDRNSLLCISRDLQIGRASCRERV